MCFIILLMIHARMFQYRRIFKSLKRENIAERREQPKRRIMKDKQVEKLLTRSDTR